MNIIEKGVLLSGYYGCGNAGDEAILQSAVNAFKKRGIPVGVLARSPNNAGEELGVPSFGRQTWGEILRGILSSKAVLSGGGGLFQDTTSLKSLIYYLRIPTIAKLLGRKTMVFGQGIGPINTSNGKLLTRLVCNYFIDAITVRDEESKKILRDIGVKKPIQVTADLAFLFPEPAEDEIERISVRFRLEKGGLPLFGVVLRRWPGMEAAIPRVAESVSRFSHATEAIPVLLSFQAEQDNPILQALDRNISIPHVNIPESLSPREILALMANFKFVVGMRLHSLIFAASLLIPFLGIGYDFKVKSLAEMLGMPFISFEELSTERLSGSLLDLWRDREKLQETLKEQIPALRKKAETNIEEAVNLVKGGSRR